MKFKIFEPSAFITTFTQKLIAKSDSKKRLHHEIEVFVGKSIFKPEITNSIDVLDCFPFFSATKRNCKITEKAKLSRNKKPSDKTIYINKKRRKVFGKHISVTTSTQSANKKISRRIKSKKIPISFRKIPLCKKENFFNCRIRWAINSTDKGEAGTFILPFVCWYLWWNTLLACQKLAG